MLFKKKLLILIDGTLHLYRSYYALPTLINKDKKPRGAIYGFLRSIRNLINTYNPTHIAIVFDDSTKNFRNIIYKKYKLNRPKIPKKLLEQFKPLYKIIKYIGFSYFIIPEFEADDVIGTISLNAKKHNLPVIISTTDKDIAQLVNKNIQILDPKSKNILGPTEIKKKFGISPNLIIDYLSLTGDKIDNIPGIPGIGKKTAIVLLKKIGNLKKIYQNLNKINLLNFNCPKKIKNKIVKNKKNAFLSYKLAKLKTNIKLNINYSMLIINKLNIQKLNNVFKNNYLKI